MKAAIMGSTGSIGTQALDVCRNQNIEVSCITGNKNYKLLEKQAREFKPGTVVCTSKEGYESLKISLKDLNCKVLSGREGLIEATKMPCDILLNSIVGIAGLPVTVACLEEKNKLALANKESLVTAGLKVMKMAKDTDNPIIPVDSEHSAIFQSLNGERKNEIEKIILTCSGGPFFGKKKEDLKDAGLKETLNHPNWSMGRKITVDSATLMNKGFELTEAMHLFDVPMEKVEILIHRQSILHSAVEFTDGAVIGQMGTPDMKLPIQYAFTYPKRAASKEKKLSLSDIGTLTFCKPDYETFGCLTLTKDCIKKGGLYPAFLNGANEKAVELFLNEKIGYLQIEELIGEAVAKVNLTGDVFDLEDIYETDLLAKRSVTDLFERL